MDRGHEVRVWSTGAIADMPSGASVQHLPVARVANVPTEISELLSGMQQAWRLRQATTDGFVYQRYSLNNLAGWWLARTRRVPLVLEVNASEVWWRREWSTLRFVSLAQATERLLLTSADRVIAVSHNAAVQLGDGGIDRSRLRVVANGVDVERFAVAHPRALPFESTACVIAFCGLFYPWHGVRYLAQAFAQLVAERPHARLLLVGDGTEANLVRSMLAADDGAFRFHITGVVRRGEVPSFLTAADILVSPHAAGKDFVGSPIKIFEYMASGRAIVASRLAQIAEILDHERTALLTTPGDSTDLHDALLRLVDDVSLRRRLGAAAQAEARARHSWDMRLAQMLGGNPPEDAIARP